MKKIKILFQDKNILIIDKPAGLSVFGSDFDLVKNEKEKNNSVDKKYPNYFIVHRLDKETTGCLILAKNKSTALFFKQQFQNHLIKKQYIAVVWGWPKFDTGIIDLPIARNKNDFRKKQTIAHNFLENIFRGEERKAITRYKVEKRFEKFGEKLSLVRFYPLTGRTHQIRVHIKSLGHPIVADRLYGPVGEKSTKLEKRIFKSPTKARLMLHAESVTFSDFATGKLIKISSKPAKEFGLEKN